MNIQQLIAYPQGTTEPITYPSGEVVLDLFKDEPIPLVLNVDDFTNVDEADASYSKPLQMPGTKKNNLFFNHIYDITSDSNFNPHKTTKIIVKEGSINTFEGYMQLNDIIIKEGAIVYDVTLYSDAINLKDRLSTKLLRDLDFAELNHGFNEDNIKDSWLGNLTLDNTLPADSFAGTGTTTDVVKYPFVRWNNDSTYYIAQGKISTLIKSDFFRPFINLLYIFKSIVRDAGYSINSNFLNTAAFNKLYVDFSKGWYLPGGGGTSGQFRVSNSTSVSYGTSISSVDMDSVDDNTIASNIIGSNYYDTATDIMTTTSVNGMCHINLDLFVSDGGTGTHCNIFNGTAYTSMNISYTSINFFTNPGDTIEIKISRGAGTLELSASSNIYFSIRSDTQFINDTLLGDKGDINQWDFFKSVKNMFNLVVIPGDNDNITIEPYNDWVDTGKIINLTNKIEEDEIKYSPITGLAKKIVFEYAEDKDDWITINHNSPNRWKYPHAATMPIDLFDKVEQKISSSAFSSTYIKDILGVGIIAPQIIDNDYNNVWNNNMRVLYDNGVYTSGVDIESYAFNSTDYLRFSSVDSYPNTSNTNSYNFGVVNYSVIGSVLNSLYNVYWAKYISELYHKDTRMVKVSANLKSSDISDMNFNDIILIKNKKFRLHKIDYRAGAISKLELINIKDL